MTLRSLLLLLALAGAGMASPGVAPEVRQRIQIELGSQGLSMNYLSACRKLHAVIGKHLLALPANSVESLALQSSYVNSTWIYGEGEADTSYPPANPNLFPRVPKAYYRHWRSILEAMADGSEASFLQVFLTQGVRNSFMPLGDESFGKPKSPVDGSTQSLILCVETVDQLLQASEFARFQGVWGDLRPDIQATGDRAPSKGSLRKALVQLYFYVKNYPEGDEVPVSRDLERDVVRAQKFQAMEGD